MGPAEGEPFVEARFTVRERLHLLTHEMADEPSPPELPVTRATRRDRPAVLALDDLRVHPLLATRCTRIARRVARRHPRAPVPATRSGADPALTGYAITGRAGNQGYLQRIAVHPNARRRLGLGHALVADAMHWLWRQGVVRSYVNTQLENQAALALYESFGFRVLPTGLAVLGRSL